MEKRELDGVKGVPMTSSLTSTNSSLGYSGCSCSQMATGVGGIMLGLIILPLPAQGEQEVWE